MDTRFLYVKVVIFVLGIFFDLGFDAHIDIHDDSNFLFFTQSSCFLSYRLGVTGEAPLQSGFSAPCTESPCLLFFGRSPQNRANFALCFIIFFSFLHPKPQTDASYVSEKTKKPLHRGGRNGSRILLTLTYSRAYVTAFAL